MPRIEWQDYRSILLKKKTTLLLRSLKLRSGFEKRGCINCRTYTSVVQIATHRMEAVSFDSAQGKAFFLRSLKVGGGWF